MPAKTPSSIDYSPESGRAFILRPTRSRLLLAWLVGIHIVGGLAVLALPVGLTLKIVLAFLLAAHACWRRPRRPPRIVRNSNGLWSLPDRGRTGLGLGPATRYGGWWVDLRLAASGVDIRVLLLRDQLRAPAWRVLQATLRR